MWCLRTYWFVWKKQRNTKIKYWDGQTEHWELYSSQAPSVSGPASGKAFSNVPHWTPWERKGQKWRERGAFLESIQPCCLLLHYLQSEETGCNVVPVSEALWYHTLRWKTSQTSLLQLSTAGVPFHFYYIFLPFSQLNPVSSSPVLSSLPLAPSPPLTFSTFLLIFCLNNHRFFSSFFNTLYTTKSLPVSQRNDFLSLERICPGNTFKWKHIEQGRWSDRRGSDDSTHLSQAKTISTAFKMVSNNKTSLIDFLLPCFTSLVSPSSIPFFIDYSFFHLSFSYIISKLTTNFSLSTMSLLPIPHLNCSPFFKLMFYKMSSFVTLLSEGKCFRFYFYRKYSHLNKLL